MAVSVEQKKKNHQRRKMSMPKTRIFFDGDFSVKNRQIWTKRTIVYMYNHNIRKTEHVFPPPKINEMPKYQLITLQLYMQPPVIPIQDIKPFIPTHLLTLLPITSSITPFKSAKPNISYCYFNPIFSSNNSRSKEVRNMNNGVDIKTLTKNGSASPKILQKEQSKH